MNKFYLLLCSALLLGCGIMVSCNGNQAQSEMPMVKYETKVLQPETKTYNMSFPATTSGTTEIKVYPQIEGLVTQKNFSSGTLVKKGQTLLPAQRAIGRGQPECGHRLDGDLETPIRVESEAF